MGNQGPGNGDHGTKTRNREQSTGKKEQGSRNREPGTRNRDPVTGNREAGTGNQESGTRIQSVTWQQGILNRELLACSLFWYIIPRFQKCKSGIRIQFPDPF